MDMNLYIQYPQLDTLLAMKWTWNANCCQCDNFWRPYDNLSFCVEIGCDWIWKMTLPGSRIYSSLLLSKIYCLMKNFENTQLKFSSILFKFICLTPPTHLITRDEKFYNSYEHFLNRQFMPKWKLQDLDLDIFKLIFWFKMLTSTNH